MHKIVFVTLIASLMSLSAFAGETVSMKLDGKNRTDNYTATGFMRLQGVASDGKEYSVALACISDTNNTTDNKSIGELHLMNGPSHVGSSAKFSYEYCLALYEGLKEMGLSLNLLWDDEDHRDFMTGTLSFSVKSL